MTRLHKHCRIKSDRQSPNKTWFMRCRLRNTVVCPCVLACRCLQPYLLCVPDCFIRLLCALAVGSHLGVCLPPFCMLCVYAFLEAGVPL